MKETYSIIVEVRDISGKIPLDENGNKRPDIKFELLVDSDAQLEANLRGTFSTIKSWIPKGYSVEIGARFYNNLSQTYMLMYSLHDSGKFIKHS